ncbi:translation initiation factor eIF-1A [Candidatus Micrarchaeota archaeon]|nr:translation initiation factor eIF-1A [Candidatus Micrarchaeota archaeon]MBD3418397.1 translation initiation factor eIF-1A [Candidatus Micrarchaeota archaeon]
MAAGGRKKKPFRPKRKPKKKPAPGEEQQIMRVKLPKQGEVLGIVTGIMGGGRMTVLCNDGKERMGRIPGKLKRRIWVREGDAVIVRPWEIEGDKKGEVIWRYHPNERRWLQDKGYLKVG